MNERVILHVDMDSFFASCEQQANPVLRGRSIAVSGDPKSRTVVAAASKEAKRFGVRSAMTIGEARRLCPDIQFVLGDPDKYVEVSRRVLAILESYTPDVEVASIDEAFMDVTGWADRYACAVCRTASCGAIRLAREIKRRIGEEIGEWMTCSIGIASNKRLTKLASEFDKPDGLVVVYADDLPVVRAVCHPVCHCEAAAEAIPLQCTDGIAASPRSTVGAHRNDSECVARLGGRYRMVSRFDLLSSISLRDLCGIGPRIEARLQSLGITTVGALAAAPLDLLVEEFGSYGYELHDMAWGHDASSVRADDVEPKSMGHAVTLPRDLRTLMELRPVIEELSERVAARLRRQRFRGSVVHLTLRFRDFTSRSEQRMLTAATNDGRAISRTAVTMAGEWRLRQPVRLVGVAIGKLCAANPAQVSLFPDDQRWQAATAACDAANDRYGAWTVQRGSLMNRVRVGRKVAAAFRATSHLRGERSQ